LIIGTRGSSLALSQANLVKEALEKVYTNLNVELKIVKTKGDKILDVALSKIGDKGLFTKELENELFKKNVDIAVHSLKDLPTQLPEGLVLGGVLQRGEFRDALIHISGKNFNELTEDDIIATSSLRRRAQLMKHSTAFRVVDIRGNVNTRIKKMNEGYCTAMIMAAAGLQRLNMDHMITQILDPEIIVPAVSQGAIAMEVRDDDKATKELLNNVTHKNTLIAITAERLFLGMIEGGCQVPVGCYSKITGNKFKIEGFVSDMDGSKIIRDHVEGDISRSDLLARELANLFIKKGAPEIIEQIRKMNKG